MGRASGVIKANAVGQLPNATFRSFQINDVMDEARAFVAKAHAEAEETLRQAELRARQIEEEARRAGDERGYREGYERGLAEGREAGRQEAFEAAKQEFGEQQASLISACQQIISTIEAEREAWETAARQDLIDLAMAIARRVAHHVGREHREVVLANLEEAVRLVGARTDVTITVHPLDAEAARAFAQSLMDLREQWQKVRIVEEPELSPGGCRVHWGSGSIDSTLETQLDRIEAELNKGKAVDSEPEP
ncbi:MAG TPA: FliH/SctL family protein [Phycisphaerae bacterium]|nr:FliH/SctL family protein [Phycisphaerae bacterium]HOJ74292.1 FliH/SctL family protein [Phycisphaerae bacterium]HON66909.1 FliH/SctL family protein [Phycisphaerae bacterium]HOQ84998.1 FliH/SctL family protein [Phycisphaerae bacterium]HPP26666.1 FliH/SctL family protein [Phycisphaerae bacterium]